MKIEVGCFGGRSPDGIIRTCAKSEDTPGRGRPHVLLALARVNVYGAGKDALYWQRHIHRASSRGASPAHQTTRVLLQKLMRVVGQLFVNLPDVAASGRWPT